MTQSSIEEPPGRSGRLQCVLAWRARCAEPSGGKACAAVLLKTMLGALAHLQLDAKTPQRGAGHEIGA